MSEKRDDVTTPAQASLPLGVAKEIEIDGVGMGVLTDGTAYLTARGLARMCGIDHTAILRISTGWNLPKLRPREEKIIAALRQQGIKLNNPFIQIVVDGSPHNAYPDSVCMAVLEYYAFETTSDGTSTALHNYRRLARNSFREFIYNQVGYSPQTEIPYAWQQFHDRVSLVYEKIPAGYFSVFKEVSDIIVSLIRAGAKLGSAFVPDISIGQHWSKYWKENNFAECYGERRKYEHNYPEYFAQAASNPQSPYCYPDAALGEFRRWMREHYLPKVLPVYLGSKTKQGALPSSFSEMALKAITGKEPS